MTPYNHIPCKCKSTKGAAKPILSALTHIWDNIWSISHLCDVPKPFQQINDRAIKDQEALR